MISPALSLIILLEVLFTLLITWGFLNEEKFIRFEDKIILKIKSKLHRK